MSPARNRYRIRSFVFDPLCVSVPLWQIRSFLFLEHRFSNPFVPITSELLFSQSLCFHQLLRCPLLFSKSTFQRMNQMTRQSAKPSFINHSARCTHVFPNGLLCHPDAT